MNETTPQELADDAVMVDVREQDEWDAGHAPGAVHIPLADVPGRVADLPTVEGQLPIICKAGGRSARAAAWLAAQGYDVVNVDGGMGAWAQAGKSMESTSGTEAEVI